MIKRLIPASFKQKAKLHLYYHRFRAHTMIPQHIYIKNLELAEKIRYVEGDIVECGVWKGGMIGGMAALLGNSRNYVLFDSFEGLPEAQEIDGERAINWQKNTKSPTYYNNCKAAIQEAEAAMKLSGVNNYQLCPGWFEQTLPKYNSRNGIALLRLDADWYSSTYQCLTHLFAQVVPNGIIIIDDYFAWDGCAKAVHDFLSQHQSPARIRTYDNLVCWIKK